MNDPQNCQPGQGGGGSLASNRSSWTRSAMAALTLAESAGSSEANLISTSGNPHKPNLRTIPHIPNNTTAAQHSNSSTVVSEGSSGDSWATLSETNDNGDNAGQGREVVINVSEIANPDVNIPEVDAQVRGNRRCLTRHSSQGSGLDLHDGIFWPPSDGEEEFEGTDNEYLNWIANELEALGLVYLEKGCQPIPLIDSIPRGIKMSKLLSAHAPDSLKPLSNTVYQHRPVQNLPYKNSQEPGNSTDLVFLHGMRCDLADPFKKSNKSFSGRKRVMYIEIGDSSFEMKEMCRCNVKKEAPQPAGSVEAISRRWTKSDVRQFPGLRSNRKLHRKLRGTTSMASTNRQDLLTGTGHCSKADYKDAAHTSEENSIPITSLDSKMLLLDLGKAPGLKRRFGAFSLFGFSMMVLVSWETILYVMNEQIDNGGSAGSIYGYLFVWFGNLCAYASMSEMASIAPTAAGQYFWVTLLAPKKFRKSASYVIGWLTVLGWQALVASGGYVVSSAIEGVLVMHNPDFNATKWQNVLLYWAVLAMAVIINVFIATALPSLQAFILAVHVWAFYAILVPTIYTAPRMSPKDVFTLFYNGGGWSHMSLSFLVGLSGPTFAMVGADAPVHMSEETFQPEKSVPKAMMWSIGANGALGFVILIVALLCTKDQDVMNMDQTGIFIFAVFEGAYDFTKPGMGLAIIMTVCLGFATVSWLATASRITWGFARDKGLPAHKHILKVAAVSRIPKYAIAFSMLISVVLSTLLLGSPIAFNIVVSLSITGIYSTTLSCNLLLLWRRFSGYIKDPFDVSIRDRKDGDYLIWGPWRIREPWGTCVNIAGCVFQMIIVFFTFWPFSPNPTATTANWSLLILGSVIVLSILYYNTLGHKAYMGMEHVIRRSQDIAYQPSSATATFASTKGDTIGKGIQTAGKEPFQETFNVARPVAYADRELEAIDSIGLRSRRIKLFD